MNEPQLSSLRSVAHPLRLRMLSLLTGTSMSAAEVARELEITHANASYHLRQLLDAGQLVVDGEERIRGGVAKRYRHVWDSAPSSLSVGDPEQQVRAMASELVRRFQVREKKKTLLTDAELWVTPEVWERARDLLQEASALVHDNAAAPRTEGTKPVNLSIAAFGMAR
ncbi:MAG TPA: helix-turn-helix domain-containing protein [Nocardioides sp.]|nr:helix-turn-helix domain-containing protein [Nocardioides sp.]